MSDTADRHVPVLLDRCVELLSPSLTQDGAVVIDGTLGLGGHAEAILEGGPGATLVGIDRDPNAIAFASTRLARFANRFVTHHATYDDMPGALAAVGADRANGILLDLGVSSMQIDNEDRGFSYAHDAPLDMRMDQSTGRTAADLLRDESEGEITRILREYGEERYAPRIARAIVTRRTEAPITRSFDLGEIVRDAIPGAARHSGGNPAKRTFQALRIAINAELELLARAIPAAINALAVGGRLVVMSYHSLEDRLVKHHLAAGAETAAPVDMPVVRDEDQPYLRLLTRGAEQVSDAEASANPRSRSVRLRAAERTREAPHRRAA